MSRLKTHRRAASKLQVGDCVRMRDYYRQFLTSSTGGDVFKIVGKDGQAITIEGPMDYHQKHRKQKTMGSHQFKRTSCAVKR